MIYIRLVAKNGQVVHFFGNFFWGEGTLSRHAPGKTPSEKSLWEEKAAFTTLWVAVPLG
jgi:hypothetical protein